MDSEKSKGFSQLFSHHFMVQFQQMPSTSMYVNTYRVSVGLFFPCWATDEWSLDNRGEICIYLPRWTHSLFRISCRQNWLLNITEHGKVFLVGWGKYAKNCISVLFLYKTSQGPQYGSWQQEAKYSLDSRREGFQNSNLIASQMSCI